MVSFQYADGEHACGTWLLFSDTSRRGIHAELHFKNSCFCDVASILLSSDTLIGLPVTEFSSLVVQQQVFYAPWDMPYYPPSNPEADLTHVSWSSRLVHLNL